jgi:hypothetical protein
MARLMQFLRGPSAQKPRPNGICLTVEQLETRVLLSGAVTGAQIRSAYGVTSFQTTTGTDGAGQTIAIIDFGAETSLNTDIANFDSANSLPAINNLQVYNENGPGTLPASSSANASIETSLDVEAAHAIAPGANILLLELPIKNTPDDVATAIQTIKTYNATPSQNLGSLVSVVSMSFVWPEFTNFDIDPFTGNPAPYPLYTHAETAYDAAFAAPGITFLAATGDTGAWAGVSWPSISPNVVAVGGTNLQINTRTGAYVSESGWSSTGTYNKDGSGGGYSFYENEPPYQNGVQQSGQRTVPDIAMDADTSTGLEIYNSSQFILPIPEPVGGTSLATPLLAGVMALVNQYRSVHHNGAPPLEGDSQTLPALYSLFATTPGDFHTIQGGYNGFTAAPGYNLVTGLGSPVVNTFVPDLAAMDLPPVKVAQVAQAPSSAPIGSSSAPVAAFLAAPANHPPTNSSVNVPRTFQLPSTSPSISQTAPITPGTPVVAIGGSEGSGLVDPGSVLDTNATRELLDTPYQDLALSSADLGPLAVLPSSPLAAPPLDWANRDAYFAAPGLRFETLDDAPAPVSANTKPPEEQHRWAAMLMAFALASGSLCMIDGAVNGSQPSAGGRPPPE